MVSGASFFDSAVNAWKLFNPLGHFWLVGWLGGLELLSRDGLGEGSRSEKRTAVGSVVG